MSARVTLASGTPKPSGRDVARFRVLIEPPVRRRSWWNAVTVGDILDARVGPNFSCASRFRWYKAATGTVGIRFQPFCGRRDCPACVVDNLTETVGAAWAVWSGSADVEFFDDPARWTRSRKQQEFGVRFRGPNATVGALAIPADDGRWIFAPGRAVRGTALDLTLVNAVRAVRLLEPGADARESRGPLDYFGSIPRGMTDDQIRDAAFEAGFEFPAGGRFRWRARDVTPEQNATFVAVLRGAA